MKKLLIALTVALGLTGYAWANACTTTGGTCSSTTACNWNAAGTWTSCGGVVPTGTDTCNIAAGHTVVIQDDAMTCGATTIFGTLLLPETASIKTTTFVNSGAGGNVIYGKSTGKLSVRRGNHVQIDTTAGYGFITWDDGFTLDLSGHVVQTTVAALASGDPNIDDATCGGTNVSQKYTITPSDGTSVGEARVGGRVVVQSGQLRNRHFEIVASSAANNTITICTALTDAKSAGQNLTEHIAGIGVFPTGAFPTASRHWTPEAVGNDVCTAPRTPFIFCTGVGTGTAVRQNLAVGDKIAIVDDVWLIQSGGTGQFAISMTTGTTKMPTIHAVNLKGLGRSGVGTSGIIVMNTNTLTPTATTWDYNNMHDGNGSAFVAENFSGAKIQWNAVHDTSVNGVSTAVGTIRAGQITDPWVANDLEISDNVVYNTHNGGIEFRIGSTTASMLRGKILRNLIYHGCASSGAFICPGIRVAGCSQCQISDNVIFDYTSSDYSHGECADIYTTVSSSSVDHFFDETSVDHNWFVNCGVIGIDGVGYGQGGTSKASTGLTISSNYVSNVGTNAILGGRLYGNFVRNWSLASAAKAGAVNSFPVIGNMFVGNDSLVAAGAACASCSAIGLEYYSGIEGVPTVPVTVSDNVLRGFDYAGTSLAFYVTGTVNADFTVSNTTLDGSILSGGNTATGFSLVGWNPATLHTATINDTLAVSLDGGIVGNCSANANAAESFAYYMDNLSTTTADTSVAVTATDCTSAGTEVKGYNFGGIARKDLYDFSLTYGASALTSCSGGGVCGSRAFHFQPQRISALWGNSLPFSNAAGLAGATPFPANFCNISAASCLDTDGDGIMDYIDNCQLTYNPSQWDGNGNGKGCACDATESQTEPCQ